jgi:hypothetical protein
MDHEDAISLSLGIHETLTQRRLSLWTNKMGLNPTEIQSHDQNCIFVGSNSRCGKILT